MPKKETTPTEPLAPTVSAPLEDSTPRGHEPHVAPGGDTSFTIGGNAPNVIWCGELPPPPFVNAGHREIRLPDEATQRRGFYSDDAGTLVEGVVGYKRFLPSVSTPPAEGGE
jgi:hypothetical protein